MKFKCMTNRDERNHRIGIIVFSVFLLFSPFLSEAREGDPVTLTINSKIRYQTIEGWGATLTGLGAIPIQEWLKDPTPEAYDRLQIQDSVSDELKSKIMDDAVFGLGLNRFRLEIGPQVKMRKTKIDPEKINYENFRFKWQDFKITKWLLPLKERIEQRGDPMVLYISYDLRSRLTPSWLLQPKEYAEMAVVVLTHLKKMYNLEPNYWSVLNEPGNHRPGSPESVAELIVRTGKRIKEAGFRTRMSGPEVVNPKQITAYMKALSLTPGALKQMGQLTYHLYGDPMNIPQRNEIRNWAQKLGITTAQTEWLEGRELNVVEALFLDLTEANASAWEQYGFSGGEGDYFVIQPVLSSYRMNKNSWYLRQIMNYIRPGDVRMMISSSSPVIKPLAFLKPDGRQTVAIINSDPSPISVQIENLAPETYEVILTDSKNKGKRLPQEYITSGQPLLFEIPPRAIVTFYCTKGIAQSVQ